MVRACRLHHLSVCLSVCLSVSGKYIVAKRLFGMVRGVGRGMGVLDGVVIVGGEWAVLGMNLGRPIVVSE